MDTKDMIEMSDLEPQGEVKGGGDFDGDGRTDIITGAEVKGHVKSSSTVGLGANGHVRVFDGKTF